jgi:ankyrin repeat protein
MGADIQAQDSDGFCSLSLAILDGHAHLVPGPFSFKAAPLCIPTALRPCYGLPLLLDAGVNIHATDYSGQNAVHYAAESGRGSCVAAFAAYGADVNEDLRGRTPLMSAVSHCQPAVLRALLHAGCTPHTAYENGVPALLVAADRNTVIGVCILCASGVDVQCGSVATTTPGLDENYRAEQWAAAATP